MRETATENNKGKNYMKWNITMSYLEIRGIDCELTPDLADLGIWSDSYTACSCEYGIYHSELCWNDIKGKYKNLCKMTVCCANH